MGGPCAAQDVQVSLSRTAAPASGKPMTPSRSTEGLHPHLLPPDPTSPGHESRAATNIFTRVNFFYRLLLIYNKLQFTTAAVHRT